MHEIELGDNVPSEDLMYDANIDKDNEEWMRKKRRQYSSKNSERYLDLSQISRNFLRKWLTGFSRRPVL